MYCIDMNIRNAYVVPVLYKTIVTYSYRIDWAIYIYLSNYSSNTYTIT